MNIEKIKNYNQKLLAILGTIAVLFAIVGLIGFTIMFINEYRWNNVNTIEEGILSEEKIEELQKENKREQVISYETPKLVDTLNAIYVVPVAHKTLNEVEDIDLRGLLSASESANDYRVASYKKRYSKRVYGDYNNLIIYNAKDNSIHKLLDERANFNNYTEEHFDDDILLLFKVAEKDTYKDGVINLDDFKSLYIYSFHKKELKKVELENADVIAYRFFYESKELIIRFGIDKNNDGQYTELNEPSVIKKYDITKGKLTDIIDPVIDKELQKTLEGSN